MAKALLEEYTDKPVLANDSDEEVDTIRSRVNHVVVFTVEDAATPQAGCWVIKCRGKRVYLRTDKLWEPVPSVRDALIYLRLRGLL